MLIQQDWQLISIRETLDINDKVSLFDSMTATSANNITYILTWVVPYYISND